MTLNDHINSVKKLVEEMEDKAHLLASGGKEPSLIISGMPHVLSNASNKELCSLVHQCSLLHHERQAMDYDILLKIFFVNCE